MNLLFICGEFPVTGRATGGFGTYVDNITRELVKLGHEVSIVCLGYKRQILNDKGRDIHVITPPFQSLLFFLNKIPLKFMQRLVSFTRYPLGFSYAAAITIVKKNQTKHFQLIEAGDFAGEAIVLLLLKRFGLIKTPVVIKLHTPSFVIREFNQEKRSLFYILIELLEKYCIKWSDVIYSPTRALKRLVESHFQKRVAQIIPYPIKSISSNSSVKRDKTLILYAGKIQFKKGVADLITAFAILVKKNPQLHLVLIGQETYVNGVSFKESLMSLIEKLNIVKRVTFLPPVTQKNLFNYYRKAAVLVVPSHWENFPNVILEAGLTATPVVATKTGGIIEMVEHKKTGLLVKPRSPQSLKSKVQYVLKHKSYAVTLGNNLRKHIRKNYSARKIVKITLKFYQRYAKLPIMEKANQYSVPGVR